MVDWAFRIKNICLSFFLLHICLFVLLSLSVDPPRHPTPTPTATFEVSINQGDAVAMFCCSVGLGVSICSHPVMPWPFFAAVNPSPPARFEYLS